MMVEQVYLANWQKVFIIGVITLCCTGYACFSRWLDSKELEFSKVSVEKKLQEHEQTYRLVLNSYARFIAKSDQFSHPVVKQVSKLENGDLLLIIGDAPNKKVEQGEAGFKAVLKKKMS